MRTTFRRWISSVPEGSFAGAWRYHRWEFLMSAIVMGLYFFNGWQDEEPGFGRSVIFFLAFVSPFISLFRLARSTVKGSHCDKSTTQ